MAVTALLLALASTAATEAQPVRGTVRINFRNTTTYFARVSFLHRLCKFKCADVPVDSGPGSESRVVDPNRAARFEVRRQEYIKMRVQVLDACDHPFATLDACDHPFATLDAWLTDPNFINWTLREIGKSQRFEITNP